MFPQLQPSAPTVGGEPFRAQRAVVSRGGWRSLPRGPGRYPVVCAELCGPYHGGMRSTVVVESADDYDAWFQANRKLPVSEA